MSKLVVWFLLLVSIIPAVSVIGNYIDVQQAGNFSSAVANMSHTVYTLRDDAREYYTGSVYLNVSELKAGVYDVSNNKTLLRELGIYDDYVSVYQPGSSVSYDYAYKVYNSTLNGVMCSVNRSWELFNNTMDLMINITKTYNQTSDYNASLGNVYVKIINNTITLTFNETNSS